MTTTVRLTTPGQVATYAEETLGFYPWGSLVMIAPNVVTARVDIPEAVGDYTDLAVQLTDSIVRLAGPGFTGPILLLAFTDDQDVLRRFEMVFNLVSPHKIRSAIRVADGRTYTEVDGMIRTEEYETSPTVALSRSEVAQTIQPAATRISLDAAAPDHHTMRTRILDQHDSWRIHGIPESELPDLIVAMSESLAVRDTLWTRFTRDNAYGWVETLTNAARICPDERRTAPMYALLAFAAWLSGNGALAWMAVERADDLDPTYSLTRIVEQALRNAVPPSAWPGHVCEG